MNTLEELKQEYIDIARKQLLSDSNIVWGEGNLESKIMLIGEAPGQKEDEMQRAFVGASGKNLNEFLDILGLKRQELYITNVVKVRPYKVDEKTKRKSNRPPNKNELLLSIPILIKEINIIKPMIVVTLGNTPLKALLGNDYAIGKYHGKDINLDGYILFILYHPASIIYNRELKDIYIEDLYKLKELINKVIKSTR